MIQLRITADAPDAAAPFVVRVEHPYLGGEGPTARVVAVGPDGLDLTTPVGPLRLGGIDWPACAGDILLVMPRNRIAHRLIRTSSAHNTFLVTEQCDQACVMCSQPPKKHHVDLFPLFETAALLAPTGITVGISGGEPTLHKEALFSFLRRTLSRRPDLAFHVLTNAQHFTSEERRDLSHPSFSRVVWGIPVYAEEAALHDRIVKKEGAFERLMCSFEVLARGAARIEVRTVLLRGNAGNLPALAGFIATMLPFVHRWAIMQLENIGYARMNWHQIFYDHSRAFEPVASALDIARARGVDARLYNFPLCTVPKPYRALADCSISDWKQRYLDVCKSCKERSRCTGFFEWYPENNGFQNIAPQ